MLKKLRQYIENKRDTKHWFWKNLVCAKDFLWEYQDILYYLKWLLKLRKIDPLPVPKAPGEIRLFMVVRNEAPRLPFFFEHYLRLGVDRFFIIDNGSTDQTIPFLLTQKNTHVFKTGASFGKAKFGSEWLRILMRKFGKKHWGLVTDADEILIYPHYEKINLKKFCSFLDKEGSNALNSLLLHMYKYQPFKSLKYKKALDFLKEFPYFDRKPCREASTPNPECSNVIYCKGDMPQRMFGLETTLNKVILFKFNPKIRLSDGQHFVHTANLSSIRGALLHFKYTANLLNKATEETERKEHFNNGVDYKIIADRIIKETALNPYYQGSVKFKNSRQLVDLKILETSDTYEYFVEKLNKGGNISLS